MRLAFARDLPLHALVGALAVVLAACGSNASDVPPDLVDAIRKMGEGADYPPGPYGTRTGEVVRNLCFDGWRNPKADAYDPARLERICLSDFRDAGAKLLMIESCAIWCAACKAEYGGSADRPSLSEHFATRETKGFRLLGTIFEDGQSNPAETDDAVAWATTYDLSFPFAKDPDYQIAGLFSSPQAAPFNLLVDTATMKIVLELEGDEPATLFGAVDDFLSTH